MDTFSQAFIFTDAVSAVFDKTKIDLITFAIIFVIGIALLLISSKVGVKPIRQLLGLFSVAGILGGGICLLVLTMVYLNMVSIYRSLQTAYDQGMYQIVEGAVEVSYAQPAGCNETGDLIRIDNVEFEINYCHGAPFSYNQAIENNGVLTEGAIARVYFTEGKTILRVDIQQ